MTAAMRMMEDNLKAVDGVMIVLDARAPRASLNSKLDKLFINKKVLYVLNKTDLVEAKDVSRTVSEFVSEGKAIVAVSAMDKKAVDLLYTRIFALLKEKLERNKEKGIFKPIRIMVAGIPNTGKSTIINALCGGKKAVTGNKAGVTKGKQWVRLKDLELLDTPGTMPPAFDNQTLAKHLAYIGSMNDANIDFNDLAYELLGELKEKYPELIKKKYDIEDLSVPTLELYEKICVRRGFLRRGGEFDYERLATAIIDDFRKGRIGKIILD
jgi:ribosome biogenesis GTPase A